MRWDEGRALFRCTIHVRRHKLTVPVQLLRPVGLIVNVDDDLPALFETEQRAGKLAVVGSRGDDAIRGQFNRCNRDGQLVIGADCIPGSGFARILAKRTGTGST